MPGLREIIESLTRLFCPGRQQLCHERARDLSSKAGVGKSAGFVGVILEK